MAKATIKIIPRQEQVEEFNYSSDIKVSWDYLASIFYKSNIDCEVGALMSGELVLWFDGIAVPLHWCSVTDLTEEEEELVLEYV
tara:strand:+ start:202 stop:453 length:252 start_codon:yes stop_codon:yes gene_type:complete